MKDFYETVPKTRLVRRMPVAVRIDGKSFHTFTRGFEKPFDRVLMRTMQETMKYLCENIQGCVLGYTQSDEITLILVDYKKLNSSAWFDYEVQKMCDIGAGMATMAFNREFLKNMETSPEMRLSTGRWRVRPYSMPGVLTSPRRRWPTLYTGGAWTPAETAFRWQATPIFPRRSSTGNPAARFRIC